MNPPAWVWVVAIVAVASGLDMTTGPTGLWAQVGAVIFAATCGALFARFIADDLRGTSGGAR